VPRDGIEQTVICCKEKFSVVFVDCIVEDGGTCLLYSSIVWLKIEAVVYVVELS
jgi:hypothetical protein